MEKMLIIAIVITLIIGFLVYCLGVNMINQYQDRQQAYIQEILNY